MNGGGVMGNSATYRRASYHDLDMVDDDEDDTG